MPWWVWTSAAPLALGAWAPIVPGRQLRRPRWVALGALWSAVALVGWVLAVTTDGDSGLGGLFIIVGWVGATATALTIRPSYVAATASSLRREAQKLALQRPELALELGIGRPDRPGAEAAGLVDVNNAPLSVLLGLPGVDDALATRIGEARAQINGFSSVQDLGSVLDLDAYAVERLEDLVVFLPR
jgi:DNA uptake protein ComE-like DNA-binding protein